MTKPTSNKRRRRMAREPKTGVAAARPDTGMAGVPAQEAAAAPSPKEPSKTEKVLSLLQRTKGATLDELVEATGWLPHTTRAALTGLRKKGHSIQRTRVDGVSRYSVMEPASR